MKLYADTAAVRTRQVLGDALVLVLTWVLVRRAWRLRTQILEFRSAAERVESAGRNVVRGAEAAGSTLQELPLVGDAIAAPFRSVADAGHDLSMAGTDAASAIDGLGVFLPLLLVGLVLGFVLFRYLPDRIAWVREATEIGRLLTTPHGERLLAHRAAANRPLRALLAATPDPAGALSRGEWHGLAELELRAMGLRGDLGTPR